MKHKPKKISKKDQKAIERLEVLRIHKSMTLEEFIDYFTSSSFVNKKLGKAYKKAGKSIKDLKRILTKMDPAPKRAPSRIIVEPAPYNDKHKAQSYKNL